MIWGRTLRQAAKAILFSIAIAMLLAGLGALAGCAGDPAAPAMVREAVAEPPCAPGKLPKRPAYAADSLTGGEDIWTLGTAIWADRKARQGYIRELEAFAAGCAGLPGL